MLNREISILFLFPSFEEFRSSNALRFAFGLGRNVNTWSAWQKVPPVSESFDRAPSISSLASFILLLLYPPPPLLLLYSYNWCYKYLASSSLWLILLFGASSRFSCAISFAAYQVSSRRHSSILQPFTTARWYEPTNFSSRFVCALDNNASTTTSPAPTWGNVQRELSRSVKTIPERTRTMRTTTYLFDRTMNGSI